MMEKRSDLEWFEAYLSQELSKKEEEEFNHRIQIEQPFREAFEEHKKLRQSIEWASLANSLDQVKRIHQSLSDKDLQLDKPESKPLRKLSVAPTWALAATLVLGVLLTTFYFQVFNPVGRSSFVQLNDDEDNHSLYGTGGDHIPVFEKQIPVRISTSSSISVGPDSVDILFQIFQADHEKLVIDTSAMAVILMTPYEQMIQDFEQGAFHALYTQHQTPLPSLFQVVSDRVAFSIPMNQILWNKLVIDEN